MTKKRERKPPRHLGPERVAELKKKALEYQLVEPTLARVLKRLDVDRKSFYWWLAHDPGFRAEWELGLSSMRERYVDICEEKLMEFVEKGNLTAVIFALKCLGKARGWIQYPESSGSGDVRPPIILESNVNIGITTIAEKRDGQAVVTVDMPKLEKPVEKLSYEPEGGVDD